MTMTIDSLSMDFPDEFPVTVVSVRGEENEYVASATIALEPGKDPHMYSLFVDPTYRRHKVASNVLDYILEVVIPGHERLNFHVKTANISGQSFYESYGATKVMKTKDGAWWIIET